MGTHVRIKDFKIKKNNNNNKKESQKNTFLSKYRANTDGTDGSMVKNMPISGGDTEMQVQFLDQDDPLRVRNGNSLQYSCLENSMDEEIWQVTVHEESDTNEQLSRAQPSK